MKLGFSFVGFLLFLSHSFAAPIPLVEEEQLTVESTQQQSESRGSDSIQVDGPVAVSRDPGRDPGRGPGMRGFLSQLGEGLGKGVERPLAFSLEVFGRTGIFSFNVDYEMAPGMVGGVGISYGFSRFIGGEDRLTTVTLVPIYGTYYFNPGEHRVFLTGGMTLAISADQANRGYQPHLGPGYEFRNRGGFLLRLAPYLVVRQGALKLSAGLSIGGTL